MSRFTGLSRSRQRYVFFFILRYFFTLTNVLLYVYVLTYETRRYTRDVERNGRQDDGHSRKRVQTTAKPSFGQSVSFFPIFSIPTKQFVHISSYVRNITGRWQAFAKTGPNDRKTVVWPIGKFFFLFLLFFFNAD